MRLTFEHVGKPGIFLTSPEFLVEIWHAGGCLEVYGFDFASEEELSDWLVMRVAQHGQIGSLDPRLAEYQVHLVVRETGEQSSLRYDPKQYGFK